MPILILLVHHIRSIDLLRNLSEDVFRAIVPQKVTSAEDSDGELPGQVAAELENFDEVDREPRAQIVRLLANELLELEVYAKKPQQKKKDVAGPRKYLYKEVHRNSKSSPEAVGSLEAGKLNGKSVRAQVRWYSKTSSLFHTVPDSYDPLVTALETLAEEDLTL